MYQVFITGFRLVELPYIKPYYVYMVEVVQPNSSISHVEKRYSEFNTLHRMLKKDTEETPPFPPKRVRNCQLKVLEQRRSALETYLQKMLRLSSTKQQVLNFLGIESRSQSTGERMHGEAVTGDPKQAQSTTLEHHPILTFQCDPYLRANTTSSLPDIVTNGVLVGSITTDIMVSLSVIQIMVFIAVFTVHASTCFLRYPLSLIGDSLEINLLISPSDYYFLENSMKVSTALSLIYFASYTDARLPRKLIAVCLALSGGVMLLFGKTDNYDAMVILLIISGVFQGLIWPALCKVSFSWIQDSKLNTFFGLLSLAEYFGGLLANFLTLFLIRRYSWAFVYPPLSGIVVSISILAFLGLYLPQELRIDVPDRKANDKPARSISLMEKWTLPGVSDLSVAVFCLRLVKSAIIFWVPDFFVHKMGYGEDRAQVALSVYKIGNLLGSIGLGLVARKETILTQSLGLMAIGTLGFIVFWVTISWEYLWSVYLLAVAGFAIGGPTGAMSSSFAVALGELEGRRAGGAIVGIINGFGGFGEIFERTIVNLVIDVYGWNSMFVLLINLLCFSAFLVNRANYATNAKLVNVRQYVI